MLKKHVVILILSCFSNVWCSSSSSDDANSSLGNQAQVLTIITESPDGNNDSCRLSDIELGNFDQIKVSDIVPFLKPVPNISENRRNRHTQEVIEYYSHYKPQKIQSLRSALINHRKRKIKIERGFEIPIERDDVKARIAWIVNKIIQKDSVYLGHKVSREQKRKWVTGVMSAIIAAVLTYAGAVFFEYLASLGD